MWGPGPELLGYVDLFTVTPAEHATVSALTAEDGDVRVEWSTYEGCGFDMQVWTGRIHWDGGQVQLLDAERVG